MLLLLPDNSQFQYHKTCPAVFISLEAEQGDVNQSKSICYQLRDLLNSKLAGPHNNYRSTIKNTTGCLGTPAFKYFDPTYLHVYYNASSVQLIYVNHII
jgi:hypothetical protein